MIRKKPLVPGPDMRAAKGGGSGTKGGGVVTDIKFGGFAVRIAISNVFNIPMTGMICDCWCCWCVMMKLSVSFLPTMFTILIMCVSIPAPNNTKFETLHPVTTASINPNLKTENLP